MNKEFIPYEEALSANIYHTPEEAELAALKRLIEIVKQLKS